MNGRHAPDVLSGLLDHIRRQVGEMIYIFVLVECGL